VLGEPFTGCRLWGDVGPGVSELNQARLEEQMSVESKVHPLHWLVLGNCWWSCLHIQGGFIKKLNEPCK
jgi:hypothetical protein